MGDEFIINVKVIPKSSRESIELKDDVYRVKVHNPPENGEANRRVIELLAKHFTTAKSNLEIISGETSRHKRVLVRK